MSCNWWDQFQRRVMENINFWSFLILFKKSKFYLNCLKVYINRLLVYIQMNRLLKCCSLLLFVFLDIVLTALTQFKRLEKKILENIWNWKKKIYWSFLDEIFMTVNFAYWFFSEADVRTAQATYCWSFIVRINRSIAITEEEAKTKNNKNTLVDKVHWNLY